MKVDPLFQALCEHHYDRAPEGLRNRYLPSTIFAHRRVFKPKPPATVLPMGQSESSRNYQTVALPGPLSLQKLVHEVAAKRGLTIEQMVCQSKMRSITIAKWEYCYRARQETPYSLARIGAVIGYCDHTTIRNAVQNYPKLDDVEPLAPWKRAPAGERLTISLPKHDLEKVHRLSEQSGESRIEVIRRIIVAAL